MKTSALHAYFSMTSRFPALRWAALFYINQSARPVTQQDVHDWIATTRETLTGFKSTGYSSGRSRLVELERMGCIEPVGKRRIRYPNGEDQIHTTYGATPRGVSVMEMEPAEAMKLMGSANAEAVRLQGEFRKAVAEIEDDYNTRKTLRATHIIDQGLTE